jgi:hypothetical protein
MENWKRAVASVAFGSSAILFLKGKRPAGVLAAGVGLAVLASEYPDKFRKIQREIPYYVEQGTHFLEMATRAGARLAELIEDRGKGVWDELLAR